MRKFVATIAMVAVSLAALSQSSGADPRRTRGRAAATALTQALTQGMKAAGPSSSAYAVDLTTGQTLFSSAASTPRLPASVEKLYTTSTALLRFGPSARLTTSVYGTGSLASNGTWSGNLYLKGGGDPTFGSASYDHYAYGGGATMQQLVLNLLAADKITGVDGRLVGDESYFDSDRGTPATNNQPSSYVEGQLSALAYNRGLANTAGTAFQPRPALFATQAFAAALKADHVNVPSSTSIYTGVTPSTARLLAVVHSPQMATLIKWTNTPSDNFFAEMLLKGLGAKFGGGGTTADGVGVVKAELASVFHIDPAFNDGSGLSYSDHTSPIQVETLLSQLADNTTFVGSLAIAGETGTLSQEMNGTIAQGHCRGKTGTLQAVSNLVGYCTAKDGDTIAFAFLMNSVNPDAAHPIQDRMAEALAAYDG